MAKIIQVEACRVMGQAKRKRKMKPKFKVGDWVCVDPNGVRAHSYHAPIVGKIFQIKEMEYVTHFEDNPSPWKVIGDTNHTFDLYEEDVILDPFMTAAHNAVEKDDAA